MDIEEFGLDFQTNTASFGNSSEIVWIDNSWLSTLVIVGITCFILCLMGLSKVPTSKMGMVYGIVGMTVLILGFWINQDYTYDDGKWLIAVSMVPGIMIGIITAFKVELTGLPELVGAYNGFGGLAAALEGIGLYLDPNAIHIVRGGNVIGPQTNAMLWVQVIGSMTFTGSMVAVLKLHGTISSRPRIIPLRLVSTILMFIAIIVCSALTFTIGDQAWNDRYLGIIFLAIVTAISGFYGFIAVMAIGGGDMPVSISFLNSLSGFSTSAAGFMLNNQALTVCGAFVGCSGIILTLVMCTAMNRSMTNVLIGGFGDGATKGIKKTEKVTGVVRELNEHDVFEILSKSRSVIIVPGYGMAVAKAQHAVAEMTARLRENGVDVRFAIHPVAGRLPGHMNVLLADARVPYDIIFSMDDINEDFPKTDAVLVIGANDIVNPSAQTDPESPIAGMPVLEVWKAKQTIVMKRSLRVGYAGVDNPLFVYPNNAMYLGDAKSSIEKLLSLIKKPAEKLIKKETNEIMTETESDVEAAANKANAADFDEFIKSIPSLQSAALITVGVVKEIEEDENRVAIVPHTAKKLLNNGIKLVVETGAGVGGGIYDSEYEYIGANIMPGAQDVYDHADIVIKIREPSMHPVTKKHEINMVPSEKTLISFVSPRTGKGGDIIDMAAAKGINLLAVDAIPRISRAQSLDTLSSQAKILGYRAVIEALHIYQRFPNGETTAAGSFPPCKVLVIGAGVAGLSAIGIAANMGAVVRAFDTRLETKDQVESMGGQFLVLEFKEEGGDASGYATIMSDEFYQKEMELFRKQAKECQIIITTALIPGRPAPKLIMKDAVDNMQAGSVIVDLASPNGGNCELTKPGETYVYDNRVTIIGAKDLLGRMSWQASSMYSNNMENLLDLLCPNSKETKRTMKIDMDDVVIRAMTCVHNGSITWPPPQDVTKTTTAEGQKKEGQLEESADNDKQAEESRKLKKIDLSKRLWDLVSIGELLSAASAVVFFVVVGIFAPVIFVNQLLTFIISGFLAKYLIWDVEPALFSPLMSTSNSLSGVVILGGILMASGNKGSATNTLGLLAISVAAINVFGGFAVSIRMLLMFKKEKA